MQGPVRLALVALVAALFRFSNAFSAHSQFIPRLNQRTSARYAAAIPRLSFPDLPRNVINKHSPLNYLLYAEDALEPKPDNPSTMLRDLLDTAKVLKYGEMYVTETGVTETLKEIQTYIHAMGGTAKTVSANQRDDIVEVEFGGTLSQKPSNPSLRAAVVRQYLKTRIMFRPKVIVIDKSFNRLTLESVNDVLEGIRQYVLAAGGRELVADSLDTTTLAPVVKLRLDAPKEVCQLFQEEATHRLQRMFWSPKVAVEWL